MKNVNPAITANLNTRLFTVQEKEFLANRMPFFTELEKLIEKYESKTIRSLTDAFVAEAKKQNIPLYYDNEYGVDGDIFDWLPNAKVIDGVRQKGTITMLEKNSTESEMLKTAVKLPLSQAIERMTDELRGGYFSKNWKWLVIYLTDTKDGVPLELVCDLNDDELRLCVRKVSPDDTWRVGDDREVGFLSNVA